LQVAASLFINLPQCFRKPAFQQKAGIRGVFGGHYREFISANPGDDIRFSKGFPEHGGDSQKRLITFLVAVCVVNFLKTVNV